MEIDYTRGTEPRPQTSSTMHDHDESPITLVLRAAGSGDPTAAAELLPLVYDELVKLAHVRMVSEAPGQTLQPTALVHEAYLRVVSGEGSEFDNRGHFFAAAGHAMRRILVDQARHKSSQRRGGNKTREEFTDEKPVFEPPKGDILAVDEALKKLEATDPRKGRVVELRYFAGLTVRETAAAMGLSVSTMEQEWRYIRSWLQRELR